MTFIILIIKPFNCGFYLQTDRGWWGGIGGKPASLSEPSFSSINEGLGPGSLLVQFSSVQSFSCVQFFATPWTAARQAFWPSPAPGAYSDSCPSSQWWHPNISSYSILFLSYLPYFLAFGSLYVIIYWHLKFYFLFLFFFIWYNCIIILIVHGFFLFLFCDFQYAVLTWFFWINKNMKSFFKAWI